MLYVTWKTSLTVPDGELIPYPFEGELQSGILVGVEPSESEGEVSVRVESYGSKAELGRLVAVMLAHAEQQGYLAELAAHAAILAPGVVAFALRSQVAD